MHEYAFHMPKLGNDGSTLDVVHAWIKGRLLQSFGGFTHLTVEGCWADDDGKVYDETCVRYLCSIAPEKVQDFYNIALMAGHKANQLAVYIVAGDGRASIVSISEPIAA